MDLVGWTALVLIIGAVALALVVSASRKRGEGGRRVTDLAVLAPVVDGAVSADQRLTGSYRGRPVEAWFARIDPQPQTVMRHRTSYYVDVLRIKLVAQGGRTWFVRAEPALAPSGDSRYEFVGQAAVELTSRLPLFSGVVEAADRHHQQAMADAGLLTAIERIGPPLPSWLPRVEFAPDPRPAMMARMRGVPVPDSVRREGPPDSVIGLSVDLPRGPAGELTAERFRTILDSVVAVAELNERITPRTTELGRLVLHQRTRQGRFGSNAQPGTRHCIATASSREPRPCSW